MSSELVFENGTWSLRPEGSWKKMLLSQADLTRLVKSSDSGVAVVANVTDDGNTNSVQIQNITATLKSGTGATNNDAAYFGFMPKDSGGNPIRIGDAYGVDLFLEWTATPGNEDNDCFLAHGVNDGDISWAGGKIGSIVCFNNANGPKSGIVTRGGGQTLNNSYTSVYMLTNMRSTPVGENSVFMSFTHEAYDDNNQKVTTRQSSSLTSYNSSPANRPTDFLHLWIAIGSNNTPGAVKNFSFKAYYRVHLLNDKGISTHRPGA